MFKEYFWNLSRQRFFQDWKRFSSVGKNNFHEKMTQEQFIYENELSYILWINCMLTTKGLMLFSCFITVKGWRVTKLSVFRTKRALAAALAARSVQARTAGPSRSRLSHASQRPGRQGLPAAARQAAAGRRQPQARPQEPLLQAGAYQFILT